MSELILGFDELDEIGQHQLLTYLKQLKMRHSKKKKAFDMEAYREKLLQISVWSEEDLQVIEELREGWKNWKPQEW